MTTSIAPRLRLEVKQDRIWRFLWAKYVTGFNPKQHCARCLAGKYSKLLRLPQTGYIGPILVDGNLDEHESPWIYLCGVTRKWEWNLHIAGRAQPGASVTYEDERISVRIHDFEQIPIVASQAPPAEKEFATCRNWQFGWCAFPETHRGHDLFGEQAWNG